MNTSEIVALLSAQEPAPYEAECAGCMAWGYTAPVESWQDGVVRLEAMGGTFDHDAGLWFCACCNEESES